MLTICLQQMVLSKEKLFWKAFIKTFPVVKKSMKYHHLLWLYLSISRY